MNAAEKAAQAKAKAEESKVIDMFHEAQSYHAFFLDGKAKHPNYWEASSYKKAKKVLLKAVKLYEKCAKAGHADSMECLAFIYQDCLHDKKKAFKWYKAGAEAGNKTCMHNLGVCYQNGEGVKMSYSLAQYWFEREEQEK